MESKEASLYAVENDHTKIRWWHSIDLGHGIVTRGDKPAELLEAEFNRLQLTADMLRGKRVLDIGCNDGYMCLQCEKLEAKVVGVDGIYRDGLKYIRKHLKPKFEFYCLDFMSPTFLELGRFDIILYLGVLYHTVYPFEQLLRLARSCNINATLFLESEYYDLAGFESEPTIIFNYDGRIISDLSTPILPSVSWIEQTLYRVGFHDVTILHQIRRGEDHNRGRVTIRAKYMDRIDTSPILYASEQA